MVGIRAGKIMIALVAAVVTAAASVAPSAARVAADIPHTALPIRLIAGDIDPAVVGTLTTTEASTPGRYIVQFDRPVSSADRAALEEGGARVRGYLPEFAFAVRVDEGAAIPDVPGVHAIIAFEPSWRISPGLTDGYQVVRIAVDAGVIVGAVAQYLGDIGFEIMQVGADWIVATVDGEVDPAATTHAGVAWIEPYDLREKHNEESGTIIGIGGAHAAGYDGSTQIVAVADTGLGDAQEDGDTTDGEYGGTDPHPDIPASRIVEVLDYPGTNLCIGSTAFPDGAQDVDSGHGTHVSSSVLSDGDATGVGEGTAPAAQLVFQATEDYIDFTVLCELAGWADGYYLNGLPVDVGDLFQDAYDLGARIHSNSWGSNVSGDYTQTSADVDSFMWDNPDMLVVTSAGNSGTDGNSSGEVDEDSTGAPATAKNLLTVGASEGARSDDFACDNTQSYVNANTGLSCQTQVSGSGFNDIFTYGDAWPTDYPAPPVAADESAGNAEQMAAFSSRGPTDDGRIKPDVVAPGTWILSGYSNLYQEGYGATTNPENGEFQYDGWGFPYSTDYKYMGGTSMSAPLTSGAAAVVRDFYNKAESHEASAALTKATLINAANDLLDENNDDYDDNDYPIPNNHEGWGIIDVTEATDGDHVFADRVLVDTGGTVSYGVVAAGGTNLKISVVWTDFPSTAAAATNLVNDLDLVVTAPNGTTIYLGNVFHSGWSATCVAGCVDRLNNVENVYIETATAGTWTVDIVGFNVPESITGGGGQPFAIVIEGGTFADTEAPTWPGGAALAQTGQTGTSVTIDWSANPATDNTAVSAYDVYVDGTLYQSVEGTDATITELAESTGYTVRVEARDAAGNAAAGPSLAVTTAIDFADTDGHVFEQDIAWMAARGITVGCGGDDFCPDQELSRAQMATLLARALDLATVEGNRFSDVSGVHSAGINAITEVGITVGCTPHGQLFCPTDVMTRGQMATFMARAFGLVESSTNAFTDDDGSIHEGNIDAIAIEAITLGCGPVGLFCPTGTVTRGQLGAFLHRAFVNLGLD